MSLKLKWFVFITIVQILTMIREFFKNFLWVLFVINSMITNVTSKSYSLLSKLIEKIN